MRIQYKLIGFILSMVMFFPTLSLSETGADEQLSQKETALWGPEVQADKIISIKFGVFTYRNGDVYSIKPTMDNRLNNQQTAHYGWAIRLRTAKNIIHWKEEVFLKTHAEDVKETPLEGEDDDRLGKLIKRSEGRALVNNGYIKNDMSYSLHANPGQYVVKVTLSEGLEAYSEYQITKD